MEQKYMTGLLHRENKIVQDFALGKHWVGVAAARYAYRNIVHQNMISQATKDEPLEL